MRPPLEATRNERTAATRRDAPADSANTIELLVQETTATSWPALARDEVRVAELVRPAAARAPRVEAERTSPNALPGPSSNAGRGCGPAPGTSK